MLYGEVAEGMVTQNAFFSLWNKYQSLPERYLLNQGDAHSTERYYPLRPELAESTFYLYAATQDEAYLSMVRQWL